MAGELVPYGQHRRTGREVARAQRSAVVDRIKLVAQGDLSIVKERYDYQRTLTRLANGYDLAELAFARSTRLYQVGMTALARCGGSQDVADLIFAEWASVTHAAFTRTNSYMSGGAF